MMARTKIGKLFQELAGMIGSNGFLSDGPRMKTLDCETLEEQLDLNSNQQKYQLNKAIALGESSTGQKSFTVCGIILAAFENLESMFAPVPSGLTYCSSISKRKLI